MLTHMLDLELQKKIQSKEFEHSVDQAVQSFLYDLDFMLLEEQHSLTRSWFGRMDCRGRVSLLPSSTGRWMMELLALAGKIAP